MRPTKFGSFDNFKTDGPFLMKFCKLIDCLMEIIQVLSFCLSNFNIDFYDNLRLPYAYNGKNLDVETYIIGEPGCL